MLASVGTALPADGDWVFEPKYDGIRILAFAAGRSVALISRNGIDKTRQFPEVADALRTLHQRARRPFVVDGELVAIHHGAPARFQALQSRMHVDDANAIATHRAESPTALILFDMLVDGRRSLVTEPWRVRRQHLAALLHPPGRSDALRLSDTSVDGAAMLRQARAHDWEGIIAKRADAPYEVGRRSRAWLKLKLEKRQEFVIGGWTEPRKSREHIGAILLGYYDRDGSLVYAGHTGTGFTRSGLLQMYRRLRRIERARSPFRETPRTNETAHWVRPSVVVEIKFNEWTAEGKLRQPVFLGIREDKSPREVVRESLSVVPGAPAQGRVRARGAPRHVAALTAASRKSSARKSAARRSGPARAASHDGGHITPDLVTRVVQQLEIIERDGGAGVIELDSGPLEVSNLDKVFFPSTGHTKGDVMRYYTWMSPYLLPAIAGRPLVMKRFPNGVQGKAFYQQRAPADPPASVRTEPVVDDGLTLQRRLIGGDLATLLYIVQLGAISIDPWHSRARSVKYADYAIVDLDPGPRAPFARVVEVACAVKDVLDDLGLHAVPKTSGASGLHIVIPFGPQVPNDAAKTLAEFIATRVVERKPKIATIERWVNSRPAGAVYVDFLQNIRGKTVAGVYSVRAQRAPTVSTPLWWEEVGKSLDPRDFTIDTVPERIRTLGDLWAAGMTPNALDELMARG
jgi:bifunctional non-homologous end joining protein LigD